MNDKVCDCQFCKDYKRLQIVLPLIPEEHREWVEGMCDALWNTDEELSYKRAILDGSWPHAVEILEHALANARKKQELKEPVQEPHSCDVVDISDGPCGDPSHYEEPQTVFKKSQGNCPGCEEGDLIERINSNTGYTFLGCTDFPTCKYTKAGGANPTPPKFDYEDEMDLYGDEDDQWCMGDHQGNFF